LDQVRVVACQHPTARRGDDLVPVEKRHGRLGPVPRVNIISTPLMPLFFTFFASLRDQAKPKFDLKSAESMKIKSYLIT